MHLNPNSRRRYRGDRVNTNDIDGCKRKGLGVLLVSADLEEIFSLSDRIIVMHEGEITGNLQVDEADEEKVGLLMMGGKRRKEKCHE